MNSRRGGIILFLIIVAGTIIYFWYDGQLPFLKSKSFNLNVLPGDLSNFAQKTSDFVKNIKIKGDLTAKNVFKKVAETPKEIAANVLNETKKSAVETFKNQVAESLGIATVANSNNSAKNVAIVRPVSQGLSLFIESADDGIKYLLDWGDGEKTEGVLEPKQQRTLEHIWKAMGDYLVQVEIETQKDKQKKIFIFPVKILK